MIKLNQTKWILAAVAALVLAVALVSIPLMSRDNGVSFNQFVKESVSPTAPDGSIPSAVSHADMYLVNSSSGLETVANSEGASIDVVVDASDLVLSATSIRLIYTYSGEVPDVTIQRNSELLENGWSYLIEEVVVDPVGKVTVDIALANLTTEGYRTNGEVVLATVDFEGTSFSPANLSFDQSVTKLATKDGSEASVSFQLLQNALE